MAEDFQHKYVAIVGFIMGAIVLFVGIVGIFVTIG